MRRAMLIMMIAILAIGLCACSSTTSKDEKDPPDKEYAQAYIDILEQYKDTILSYDWQVNDIDRESYDEERNSIDTHTAIYDLNSDNVPELLFFEGSETGGEDDFGAKLHIFTYKNGQGTELKYNAKSSLNRTDAFLKDLPVEAGNSYVVYMNKNKDALYMYYQYKGFYDEYSISKFTFDGTELNRVKQIDYSQAPYADDRMGDDGRFLGEKKYYINGNEVSLDKGAKELDKALLDCSEVIMFSDLGGDPSMTDDPNDYIYIGKYFDTRNAKAKSYDELYTYLKNIAN